MRMLFIGDPLLVDGYRLAGIDSIAVNSPESLIESLKTSVTKDGLAIILLDQDYASKVKEEVYNIKLKRELPVIIEVPGRHTAAEVDLKATVSRIMGVKI
ncbi:MAG: V-type ATP synthase subunit F [Candidatus Methanomethylicia archaeon]|nr:V-type ATP synthase subunit F [Candidatus Methanomethylicia archaeon]